MAVTTTPLGFQKPDGNEPVRNGDDIISHNAQTAQDQIQTVLGRVDYVEAQTGAHWVGTPGALSPDPSNPGFYFILGNSLTPDPINAGLYLIGN